MLRKFQISNDCVSVSEKLRSSSKCYVFDVTIRQTNPGQSRMVAIQNNIQDVDAASLWHDQIFILIEMSKSITYI